MDPAHKRAFTIGVVVVSIGTGLFALSRGWLQPLVQLPPAKHITLFPNPLPKTEPAPQTAPEPQPRTPAAGVPEKPAGDPAAAAAQPKPAPGTKPAVDVAKGAFDIVRVEPSGELVVAGRCAPDCTVALTVEGKTLEQVKADPGGHWAMTPPPLAPGDHQLGLAVTTPDGKTAVSEQSVTVSVPTAPSKEVVVVLNEPNAPSRVLQRPGQAPAVAAAPTAAPAQARQPAAAPVPVVSIVAVDAEKGRLFIQGTAPAGGPLRVYLNNALLAEPVAGADQRWSVRVEKGLTPGDYAARVDHVEASSGKVLARAEARFAYEGETAAAPAPAEATSAAAQPVTGGATTTYPAGAAWNAARLPDAAPTPSPDRTTPTVEQAKPAPTAGEAAPSAAAPAPAAAQGDPADGPARVDPPSAAAPAGSAEAPAPAADAANAVVASIETTKVLRGDSLWRISRKTYGKGVRYTVIFSANDEQIRDPDLIYPGQVLILPSGAGVVTR